MRVAVGGFYHETNTFSQAVTRLADFEAYQFASGPALLEKFRGTNSEIGGMIDALEAQGMAPRPLCFAAAVPSGMIRRETFDAILQANIDALRDAGPLDAVCLSLHGAAAADGLPDADGAFASAIRRAIGPDMRLAITLDYHANVSPALIEAADFVSIYRTYPHTDMAERGREAVRIVTACELPAHCAYRKLPLVTVPLVQASADQPMADLLAAFDDGLERPGVVSNSVAMGFAYADSANLGATVLVYGDNAQACEAEADGLAKAIWEQRVRFLPDLVSVSDLPEKLSAPTDGPTVVVDPSDNIGGGSAGDGTVILETLLNTGSAGVINLTDPAAAARCAELGVGAEFDMEVGAKVDALHGAPVRLRGHVEWAGEATFRNSGSYMTGFVTSMGQSAVIRAGRLAVVVTSLRTMPFDRGVLTSVALEPEDQTVIVVKAAIAWRAAFGEIAERVLVVDTPGICPANLEQLDYCNSDRAFWPLSQTVTF